MVVRSLGVEHEEAVVSQFGALDLLIQIHDYRIISQTGVESGHRAEAIFTAVAPLVGPVYGGARAYGDCEDLASAVVAELVYNGIPARTYVYRSGGKLYHVVVKTDRWGLLDPSRAAGMEGNG